MRAPILAAITVLLAACSGSDAEGWKSFPGVVVPGGGGSPGHGGSGGSGGSVGQCNVQFNTSSCQSCMTGHCTSQCVDCQNNSDCNAILNCLMGCSGASATCQTNCVNAHPAGEYMIAAYLNTVSGCMGTQCPASCGIDTNSCGLTFQAQACNECVAANCVATCRSCVGSVDCMRLVNCLSDCNGDTSCRQSCWDANPAGQQPLNDFAGNTGCVGTKCASACQ
ncbi:MAG: hypothetical protein HY898_08240 [Deltaproteobacteria bacterium]|nr:hypothetical protein [Deltaproteobacteria bacterium]